MFTIGKLFDWPELFWIYLTATLWQQCVFSLIDLISWGFDFVWLRTGSLSDCECAIYVAVVKLVYQRKVDILYGGKLWWGKTLANLVNRPWFTKLKPSKLVLVINNLLGDLLFRQMLGKSQFAKISPRQTFSPYGIVNLRHWLILLAVITRLVH